MKCLKNKTVDLRRRELKQISCFPNPSTLLDASACNTSERRMTSIYVEAISFPFGIFLFCSRPKACRAPTKFVPAVRLSL
jgi:hypothetical protein